MGLSIESIPLVLQLNKRDLNEICTIEELNEALNRQHWQAFGASAVRGTGVFDTLKAISRITLTELAQRLDRERGTRRRPAVATAATTPSAAGSALSKAEVHPAAPSPVNGHRKLSREIELAIRKSDLKRVRRLSLRLTLEGQNDEVLHQTSQTIDLENAPLLETLLLQLNIQKQG